ncbi:MAG TPA: SMR family transporter [Bacteroidia bacterium]|nr:SMR family transporter [Bacteroidia bacterium]
MIAWVYIFIASISEICWIYSLKYLEFKKLIKTNVLQIFSTKEGLLLLFPAILYVMFGIANIVFFSKAMQKLSASVAFSVWMAIALIGVKIADIIILKESFSYLNLFFFLLILIGIIGIKLT